MSVVAGEGEGPAFLDDTWTLYFHDPDNPDWNVGSYVRVVDVSSIEDLAAVQHALQKKVAAGMFFLMREHVFPCWDDKNNIEGGCLSMKLPKTSVEPFWNELSLRLICEALVKPDRRYKSEDVVNGISISPKAFYSVVKIWTSAAVDPRDFWIPAGVRGDVLYKSNREFISANHRTLARPSGPGPVAEPNTV